MGFEKGQLDIVEILSILPHRYPFVLVDRIVEVEEGNYAVGLKNVTINEPFFQGHFPVEPVMPGVLILESMAQVGGILAYHTVNKHDSKELLYYAGLDGARFRRKVVPGDQLMIRTEITKRKGKIFKFSAKAYVEDQLAAEAGLMASLG